MEDSNSTFAKLEAASASQMPRHNQTCDITRMKLFIVTEPRTKALEHGLRSKQSFHEMEMRIRVDITSRNRIVTDRTSTMPTGGMQGSGRILKKNSSFPLATECLRPPYGVLYLATKRNYVGFNSQSRQVTKRVDFNAHRWRHWNWGSEGDLMLNGAYFTPSGVGASVSYARATILGAKSSSQ